MSDKIDTGMPMERNWVATGDKSGMSQWSTKRFTGPLWRQPTLRAYNHPVQGENLERGGLMKQVRSAVADSIQTARSEQGAGDSREGYCDVYHINFTTGNLRRTTRHHRDGT